MFTVHSQTAVTPKAHKRPQMAMIARSATIINGVQVISRSMCSKCSSIFVSWKSKFDVKGVRILSNGTLIAIQDISLVSFGVQWPSSHLHHLFLSGSQSSFLQPMEIFFQANGWDILFLFFQMQVSPLSESSHYCSLLLGRPELIC